MLSKRLKPVTSSVVGEVQSAIVGDIGIQDGTLVANEIVDNWKKKNKRGLI